MSIIEWEKREEYLHADCNVYGISRQTWYHPVKQVENDFYVIQMHDWAVTLAITPKQELVLVRQFRFGAGTFTWEFPAGVIDPGEAPLEGGLRELREESGFTGENPRILGMVEPNPALQNNRCYFVLVENAHESHDVDPDEHEAFEVVTKPIPEVVDMAFRGEITHGMIHAALFFLGRERG